MKLSHALSKSECTGYKSKQTTLESTIIFLLYLCLDKEQATNNICKWHAFTQHIFFSQRLNNLFPAIYIYAPCSPSHAGNKWYKKLFVWSWYSLLSLNIQLSSSRWLLCWKYLINFLFYCQSWKNSKRKIRVFWMSHILHVIPVMSPWPSLSVLGIWSKPFFITSNVKRT